MVWWKKKDPEEIKKEEELKKKEAKYQKNLPALIEIDRLKDIAIEREKEHKALLKKYLDELIEEVKGVDGILGANHAAGVIAGMTYLKHLPCSRLYHNSGYKREFIAHPQKPNRNSILEISHYERLVAIFKEKEKKAIRVPFWVDNEILQNESEEVLSKLPFGNFNNVEYLESCQKYLTASQEWIAARDKVDFDTRWDHKKRAQK